MPGSVETRRPPGLVGGLSKRGFTTRTIQGVEYHHARTADGGDLFLTRYGRPFTEQLHPDSWLGSPWFETHRKRLRGTSVIYRVPTRPTRGRTLDLIVRFNRMGEDLPVDTLTLGSFPNADFNTPFEEVAAVMALRRARIGPQRRIMATKRPLAIYSPPERFEPWQTGRREYRMTAKQRRLPEITLDLRRRYLLVYGWIKGIDAQDAADHLGSERGERMRDQIMAEAQGDLAQAGFRVLDMKPAHIIVRFTPEGELLRRRDGRLVYALIDYELLERA
jgi:hypothetical protein